MMSETSVYHVLFAIGRAAEQLFDKACREYEKSSLSADELRGYVRSEIERDCDKSYNCRVFWKPLTEEQKQEALTKGIPGGDYPAEWEN
jgi:hypothetical protein